MNYLIAFVSVVTDARERESKTAALLAEIPEVQEAHRVAGEDCYLLKVCVSDTDALSHLLCEKLASIKSVCSTRATIVLKTVKEQGLPTFKASV